MFLCCLQAHELGCVLGYEERKIRLEDFRFVLGDFSPVPSVLRTRWHAFSIAPRGSVECDRTALGTGCGGKMFPPT